MILDQLPAAQGLRQGQEWDDTSALLEEIAEAIVSLRADLESMRVAKSAELDVHAIELPEFLRKRSA